MNKRIHLLMPFSSFNPWRFNYAIFQPSHIPKWTILLMSLLAFFSEAAQAQDYTISTTGNAIVVTDVAGAGETISISENSGIQFSVSGKTYSLDNGAATAFPVSISLSGVTSITVNAGAGNDGITLGAFTALLPSLTINGGTGNETVNLNGDITFADDANLDLDFQNDHATPGTDNIAINTNANLVLSGSGEATVKVSQFVYLNTGASIETVNGNLLVEANQQATPTTGSFSGVTVTGTGSKLACTGAGSLTVKGKGGNSGSLSGILVQSGGTISGGSGPVSVIGTGGSSASNFNLGVSVTGTSSRITSSGGDVSVTGTGGGTGQFNRGVVVESAGQITAGSSGSVTVVGYGSTTTSGLSNHGVLVNLASSAITSSGGNVSVTGTGGGSGASGSNHGVYVLTNGTITAGSGGTVTVVGYGGNGTGGFNHGVNVNASSARITSSGGNVSVTGTEGAGSTSIGIGIYSSGTITTATSGGNLTLNANNMDIASAVSANSSSSVTLRSSDNTLIDLGTATNTSGGPLGLSDAELDLVTGGTITIGHAQAGNITVSAAISHATSNINLVTNGDITISGGSFSAGTGTLLLDCGTSPAAVKPTQSGTDVTTSALSFGSDLAIVINGTTVDAQYTQLNVAGAVNLSGVDLVLSGSYVPVVGQTFLIVANDGTDAITGTFNGLAEGATITNFLGSAHNATISYLGIGGGGNDVLLTVTAVLPVELAGFNVSVDRTAAILTWVTASEHNNRGFDVERSSDGRHWNPIGFVPGHGTTLEAQSYRFTDERPLPGTNYYRLRQMDFDGQEAYSGVVSIHLPKLAENVVQAFPNPVGNGELTLYFLHDLQESSAMLRLYSPTGQLVREQPASGREAKLDLTDLPAGVYMVELMSGYETWRERVVVQ